MNVDNHSISNMKDIKHCIRSVTRTPNLSGACVLITKKFYKTNVSTEEQTGYFISIYNKELHKYEEIECDNFDNLMEKANKELIRLGYPISIEDEWTVFEHNFN